ncbi:hypothetical protein D9758_016581 [Tetrapyrgos nigripes]|uniref:FHA domain-containing protein n=1 Tax=Tetrapyrgos nigripes TaxID=182062 RepID=A0A8H5C2F8_9AGAR|nr:hypothetical protein D9758_016581 [Tetrapyrgos nigripes]
MGPKPKPKPSKPKDDKPPTPPPMLGVEFIYEDTHLKSRTVKLYKKGNSDTVDIGWKLFDPNAKTMSEKHGRLHFEKSKAYISDLGSKKGTWVQSKRGSLVKEVKHELKEGDRIVFGAKEDKGISEDPQALRVKVKFIRESTPKSPKSPPVNKSDSNTLTVKEKSTKSRAPTPEMTLKPPLRIIIAGRGA